MRLRAPIRLNNKLSKLSIIALLGLVAFAAVVIVANPFGNQPVGASASVPAGSQPSTATAGQTGAAGQGSLLTTPPGSGSASGGTHHHHYDDGNSTVDS